MSFICRHTNRASKGALGKSGEMPVGNVPGKGSKKGITKVIRDTNTKLASSYSVSFAQMMLHEAEFDYLNQRFIEAAEKFIWIKDVVLSNYIFESEAIDKSLSGAHASKEPQLQKLLNKRCNILLTQLTQGLDYYGHYPGYVPLTTLDVYTESIDVMLPLATDIETAYEEFYDEQQDDIRKKKTIATAVSSLEVQFDRMDNQIGQLTNKIKSSREEVAHLLQEEEVLYYRVKAASSSFKSAVQRKAECGFEDVLKAGAAVAVLASGVGSLIAGGTTLYEAGSMIEKSNSIKEWKKTGEYIVKHAKVVGEGIKKISDGYNEIKDLIEQERDAGKLITAEEDFDKMIEGFKNMPEARKYQRLMHQYLNIIKLRNNKILEIDASISQVYELDSQKTEVETDIAATKIRLIEVANPRLAEHIVFFEKALYRAKSELLKSIVMAHRALNYWSLNGNKVPRDLHDRSINQIKAYYLGFVADILNLRTLRNSAPTRFITGNIEFSRDNNKDLFATFDETGHFTVEIEPSHPEFVMFSQTLVNKVQIKVKTNSRRSFKGTRWIVLRHNGNPTFVDKQQNEHKFVHSPRQIPMRLAEGEESVEKGLGSSDEYSDLSPMASWTYEMEFTTDAGLLDGVKEKNQRKNIAQVDFVFSGVTFARGLGG